MWIRFGPVQLAGSYDLNVIDLCRFSLGRTSYEWYVEIGYIYGVYFIFIWFPYRQLSNQLKSSIKWMAALPSCRYTHNGTITGRLVCLILCGFIDLLLSPFSNYSNCFHSRSTATIQQPFDLDHLECLLSLPVQLSAGHSLMEAGWPAKLQSFVFSVQLVRAPNDCNPLPVEQNGEGDQAFATNLVDGWK